jgi:hypothetical protein
MNSQRDRIGVVEDAQILASPHVVDFEASSRQSWDLTESYRLGRGRAGSVDNEDMGSLAGFPGIEIRRLRGEIAKWLCWDADSAVLTEGEKFCIFYDSELIGGQLAQLFSAYDKFFSSKLILLQGLLQFPVKWATS